MAPMYYADGRPSLDRLSEHCGFVRSEPLISARPEFDTLDHILDLTFKSIRGESNLSTTFTIEDRLSTSPWRLTLVPEGARILGSGPGTAVRGGPWPSYDPQLLLMGWGFIHHVTTTEFLAGECKILTPPYEAGVEPDQSLEYQCQITPVDLDATSNVADYYAGLRKQ